MKSNFQIFSRLFFVVLLLSFFSGCSEETPGEDSRNGTSKTEAVVPVKVVALQSGELIESVTATGTTFPLHDAVLSAEVPGTVTRILLEVGQRVEPSQVLVKLDPELKQLAVEQAEAALLEAEAAFEKLSRDLERNEKLFASKDISEFIVENARLQKQSAEAAFLAAQANFKMANRQLRNADIKSPIAGLVAVRLVELGAAVAPGVPIAKVVDISKIKIKFSVAEKDITRMKVGQSLTVSLNAIPGEDFAGKVTAVAPQADLSSRTFQVEGLIDNPDARIKAGMIAKAEVVLSKQANVVLLPRGALVERDGETFFFVVKNNRVEKRLPRLGGQQGEYVAVLEGAHADEQIVVMGHDHLKPGQAVVVR